MTLRVYLAGPDVFLSNAIEIGERKRAICARYGLDGVFPLDAHLDLNGLSPREAGAAIFRANIHLMQSCDAVIANMTPFRGPGMDVGTAFEVGFMFALGRPVFAYTNDDRDYVDRVADLIGVGTENGAPVCDAQGLAVETFGMADNLMIDVAVREKMGVPVTRGRVQAEDIYTNLDVFARCVADANTVLSREGTRRRPVAASV